MDKFTKPVKNVYGGINSLEWYNIYIRSNENLKGKQLIKIVDKNGDFKMIKQKDVAIIFKNFLIHREGTNEYNYYDICTFGSIGSNSVTAEPFELVSLKEAWLPCITNSQKKNHFLTKNRNGVYLCQPLCLFDENSDDTNIIKSRVLIEQCSRFWLSAGNNNIDMDLQHTSNMYISQQSSIVYDMFNKLLSKKILDDYGEIKKYLYILKLHFDSFKSFANLFPEILKPIQALSDSEYTCDVLQKMVASTILNQRLETDQYIRLLELALKRFFKRFSNQEFFTKQHIPGITVILIFTPIYKKIIHNNDDILKTCETISILINHFMDSVPEEILKRGFDINDPDDVNKIYIYECIKKSELRNDLDFNQVSKLYDFCKEEKNRLEEFDLETILPKFETEFSFNTENIKIRAHKLLNKCKIRYNKDPNSFVLIAKNPADWTGIILESPGRYILKPSIVGYATQGINNTRKEHMIAVVSFTTGNNILPTNKYQITSSGEIMINSDRSIYNYLRILDLTKQFEIELDGKNYTVFQDNKIFCKNTYTRRKFLMGFKFLKFTLEYKNDCMNINKRSLKRIKI